MKRLVTILLFAVIILFMGCSDSRDPYDSFKGQDLHLINGDKELFWFSGMHTNNPKHIMFEDIKAQFELFNPNFVLVEGGFNKDIYKYETDELNAKLNGESAYVAFLCGQNDIEVGSMEPPVPMQIDMLTETYDENSILAMYILRQIYQKKRESQNVDINFMEYMISFSQYIVSEGLSFNVEDIDEDFIVNILEPYTGFRVNNDNWKQINAHEMVYVKEGIVHSIYTDILNYRDEYSVNLIKEMFEEYNRVFVMMGADHIENQKEELIEFFEDMR
jgi:hypothetical protein